MLGLLDLRLLIHPTSKVKNAVLRVRIELATLHSLIVILRISNLSFESTFHYGIWGLHNKNRFSIILSNFGFGRNSYDVKYL